MSKAVFAHIIKEFELSLDWADDANCRNMDTRIFFPTNDGSNVDPFVREVCAECPVNFECLWYANETSTDHGVFAGMSPKQRQSWRTKNNVSLGQSYSQWRARGRKATSSV